MNNMKTKGINKKTKILGAIGALIIFLGFTSAILRLVSNWFDTHTLQFNKPIQITIQKPIQIKERQIKLIQAVKVIDNTPKLENLTSIEKYICDKWGIYDCKTAISVFKAESGIKEDAININTDGSVDIGIAQINSIHFGRPGCSLKELVDQYKNIDCAYSIYEEQGWTPWTSFNNSSFKKFIK